MPGRPPSAGTTRPESSASAGSPVAAAAALAFNAALASKLSPVSSGSGIPSEATETKMMAKGASSVPISSTLPELWLAMTRRLPAKARGIVSAEPERRALTSSELGDADTREPQHLPEKRFVERGALGGRLDLDDAIGPGKYEISVGHGFGIFRIVEV